MAKKQKTRKEKNAEKQALAYFRAELNRAQKWLNKTLSDTHLMAISVVAVSEKQFNKLLKTSGLLAACDNAGASLEIKNGCLIVDRSNG